jgi:hypothetical protein
MTRNIGIKKKKEKRSKTPRDRQTQVTIMDRTDVMMMSEIQKYVFEKKYWCISISPFPVLRSWELFL